PDAALLLPPLITQHASAKRRSPSRVATMRPGGVSPRTGHHSEDVSMKRYTWAALVVLSGAVATAADAGDVAEIDGLKSAVPAGWKKGKPASQMQYAVYTLPKAEGDPEDATLTVYFFGPGGGGGVDANVKRWQGMV